MDTIEGMRTFVAVATKGSFTEGARHLGISTALASKYVGQLEERLGVRLLARTTRSLSITEVGRAYLTRSQQMLDDFDALEAAIQHRQAEPSGRLILAAPVTLGESVLADAIASFLSRHSKMQVDLRLSDRFVNLVDEGIDVAMRIAEMPDSSLIARRISGAPANVCASPDYIKARGEPLHPQDVEEHDCIIDTNLRTGANWTFKENGKPLAVRLSGRVSVNSAAAARRLALAGQGLAFIPNYLVREDLKSGRLVSLLEAYMASKLGLFAVYPHNRHLAPKVRAFVDHMVLYFRNRPGWKAT